MLISLNWINELLEIENINLNELIEKLTLGGFEVEDNFELLIGSNKETILEISATANRADSISAKGIAKEIGSLIDKKAFQNQYVKNTSELEDVLQQSLSNNEILDKQYCSSFIAITVENFIDITVPEWLKQKLISSGVEPVNSLVDFQNYILLETGYPFEFYDLDKIRNDLNESEFELKLTKAGNDKSLIGTNDSEYKLDTDTLVVKANELLLSVAGLIPNQKYAIDQTTKSLLIEGAIFNSKKIRQTSRKLGLRTDRSARYEKSLNNHSFNESLVRLLNLLRINNSQIIYKTTACAQIIHEPIKSIPLIYQNILEILGPTIKNGKETQITTDQISRYLDRLDFNFSFEPTTAKWDVIVPSSRIDDIIREIDLIEEIGRLHGFNNFVSYLPNISNIGAEDFSYQTRKKLTTCFLSEGLNELMQYSLVKEAANNTQTVKLVNPLISDCSTLRTSLLPAIIETIEKNVKQGNRNIEGFEFGHVFSTTAPNVYNEKEYVGGNFGSFETKMSWSENSKNLSWFEAKGKLEDIFKKLNIPIYWKKTIPETYDSILHPYRTAQFNLLSGQFFGIFGQIHPVLAKNLNISTETYLFEFDFEMLKNQLKNNLLPLYKTYSLYPKIVKDLSFIVDQKYSFKDIEQSIRKIGTEVLIQLDLLDEYKGESIPTNCTSLCIQLTFQSKEQTLRTEEIETTIESIQSTLVQEYNIIQRI